MASTSSLPAGGQPTAKVQQLIDLLESDLEKKALSPQVRLSTLQNLKVCSRETELCNSICTKKGIKMLCTYAFELKDDIESSREALRCLVNSLTVMASGRQLFTELGYAETASERYGSEFTDDEFLLGRILFACTYVPGFDVKKLLDNHKLADNVIQALGRHSKRYRAGKTPPSPMDEMALTETLKLVYNITHFAPDKIELLSGGIGHLFDILSSLKLADPPLQPPVTYNINALMNFDFKSHVDQVFPADSKSKYIDCLIGILDKSLYKKYLGPSSGHDFEDLGAPLLILLTRLYGAAPAEVKTKMRNKLLPTPEERDKPLGKADTLSARLLNLLTSALAPNARTCAAEMLYELSDSDAYTFIRNVGYGFAAGYLVSKGIAIPQEAMKENAEAEGLPINPVTGQTVEAEERDAPSLAEMSDEEKMREAERLFVLFERLKKTGVVDVKNPVEVARDEGRFEELPDE